MLRKHEREIERLLSDTRTLTDIIDGLEKLEEFLTIPDATLDVDSLMEKYEVVSSKARVLQESLIILMQSHKNRKEYEDSAKQTMAMIQQNSKRCLIIQKMKSAMEAITPVDRRLRKEWDKYYSYVNSFFLKLQTPADFREIRLQRESLDFDLMVVSTSSGEVKPANVLSSGQRTALAISIFWTMNLYGSTIPPLMIMDEPIQQIDDLNSLNFLDTLRWIVDSGDRQVIVSTANSRIAGLIRRKFSYLEDDYNEVFLERHIHLPPVIKIFDHLGALLQERFSA